MSEKTLFKLEAILSKYQGMRNRSMRLVFDTNENLSSEQIAKISQLHEKILWLVCLHEEVIDNDILSAIKNLPMLVKDKEEKSPSQRLRGVLYIIWQKKHKDKYETFDQFYRYYLERLIDDLKSKID